MSWLFQSAGTIPVIAGVAVAVIAVVLITWLDRRRR